MAFVSSPSNNSNSSNGVNTAQGVNTANGVNTASSQVNAASSLKIDNLSDAVIYAFLASQPNSTHLVNEDLEQIHRDDLEEMDLKWQMAKLTMRTMNAIIVIKEANLQGNVGHQRDRTTGAEEGPTNYALMAYSTSSASSSDYEVKNVKTAKPKAVVNAVKAKAKHKAVKGKKGNVVKAVQGNPHEHLQDKGVIDSGCSRHMTGNMSFLKDYEEIDGGYIAFGGNPKKGKITFKASSCTV
nr:hypothetical protein [Tanacetum cinerariifolium]